MQVMEEKRTIQSVARLIGHFPRKSRRMPTCQEMLDLLGVKSKSVVHFWINKICLGSVILSALYFAPVLVSSFMK
jgi:hypothetical protein